METKYIPNNSKGSINSNNKLNEVKSDFFLKILFEFIIPKRKSLEIIKYNKYIQKRINITIKDYKTYCETYSSIEIEIIPKKDINEYAKFINIKNEDKKYYHIYFNNNKNKEIKRTNINKNEIVTKINIIIDHQIKSFLGLFKSCYFIESINFKKFYRNNIIDMSNMFSGCLSLKELDLTNFNTDNVADMSWMFCGCELLKELNLTKFNTHKVKKMFSMFYNCIALEELNISNFNTNNVTNMSYMFSKCSSLKELNFTNFNTNNVKNMNGMFEECTSLKELNLFNFNTNNETDMSDMFRGCSNELKLKIKKQYKNIKEEAFQE